MTNVVALILPPGLDVRTIGRHMSRERYQRGSLSKIGKHRKVWRGRWHIYIVQPDGSEKICKREKVLGPVAELSKAQAHEKLDGLIRLSMSQISGTLPPTTTLQELWTRYSSLKSASWSTATRKALVSIFAGKSAKKRRPSILAMLGGRHVRELTRGPLQDLLNTMAERGDSLSSVKKARTYLTAMFEYARDERLILDNPARKLEMPARLLKTPCERYYTLEEVRRLLANAHGREHLVLRIFVNCGLRPGELFALREDDIEPGRLRIDEAVKDSERGEKRVGDTKTKGSRAYVTISAGLQQELELWVKARRQGRTYHEGAAASSVASDLLFPTERGTPFRIGNYLRRYLKPLAAKAGIQDLTYQALRRTCATHFQKHGKPSDIQAQLRHTRLEMTGRYVKEIPDQVRTAVESMDRELCVGSNASSKAH